MAIAVSGKSRCTRSEEGGSSLINCTRNSRSLSLSVCVSELSAVKLRYGKRIMSRPNERPTVDDVEDDGIASSDESC